MQHSVKESWDFKRGTDSTRIRAVLLVARRLSLAVSCHACEEHSLGYAEDGHHWQGSNSHMSTAVIREWLACFTGSGRAEGSSSQAEGAGFRAFMQHLEAEAGTSSWPLAADSL